MAAVYCGSCGTSLAESAKFCRACGSAQAVGHAAPATPLPPPPSYAPSLAQPRTDAVTAASVLAIIGGAAMALLVLYAIIYQPLHNDEAVNYGIGLRLGDVVALVSGLVAVAIGAVLLTRPPRNPTATGVWLAVAGAPTLVMAILWAFPETFDLQFFPIPFYFAIVYFADIGQVDVGNYELQLPLVIACALVIAAGFLIASPSVPRATNPAPRPGP
jgi:hypothetical protein